MNIESQLEVSNGVCQATLFTNEDRHEMRLAPKENGLGTRANGGELLCLAIASCYCNDIYREAAGRHIEVSSVEVRVEAEFGGVGEAAKAIRYSVTVKARASERQIEELIAHTDRVAEIHNTIRKGMPVELRSMKAISTTKE